MFGTTFADTYLKQIREHKISEYDGLAYTHGIDSEKRITQYYSGIMF